MSFPLYYPSSLLFLDIWGCNPRLRDDVPAFGARR